MRRTIWRVSSRILHFVLQAAKSIKLHSQFASFFIHQMYFAVLTSNDVHPTPSMESIFSSFREKKNLLALHKNNNNMHSINNDDDDDEEQNNYCY